MKKDTNKQMSKFGKWWLNVNGIISYDLTFFALVTLILLILIFLFKF